MERLITQRRKRINLNGPLVAARDYIDDLIKEGWEKLHIDAHENFGCGYADVDVIKYEEEAEADYRDMIRRSGIEEHERIERDLKLYRRLHEQFKDIDEPIDMSL